MEAIRKHQQFKVSYEYDVHLKRLYPVADLQTPFGSAHVTLSAGKRSRPHQHHEHATFIILQGSGHLVQAGRQAPVAPGDVLYIEPFSENYIDADPHNDVATSGVPTGLLDDDLGGPILPTLMNLYVQILRGWRELLGRTLV